MIQGLLIAGQASNSGKTTAALGLIGALKAKGIPVRAAKAGPDFIDAGWLAKASEQPAINLDAWMCPQADRLVALAQDFALDNFLVVEGAMGLFDGSISGHASSADLAAMLNLPILLLINASGMGQSAAAIAQGFFSYASASVFCGLICTHVGSQEHLELLTASLKPVCAKFNVPLLGCLPKQGAPQIGSRHLGLVQAAESRLDLEAAGRWFTANCDLNLLLERMDWHNPVARKQPARSAEAKLKITIARDQAFSFCYADLPGMLAKLGCEIVYFSPLADTRIPACDGVYLPGGYPELYCDRLAANVGMLSSLRKLANAGLPIYGECGGYIYLCEAIEESSKIYPLAGLLPGVCLMAKKRQALGYRQAKALFCPDLVCYGHEFHYGTMAKPPVNPIWTVWNSKGQNMGELGEKAGSVMGSWLHLYPPGSSCFWQYWLTLCAQYHGKRINGLQPNSCQCPSQLSAAQ